VVQHLVDHDAKPARVRRRNQAVKILERAEERVDLPVGADVVPEVLHRRLEEGREPDRVDAEARDVVELRGNAGQVADAVAVGVGEAARIDLVDDGAAPPVQVGNGSGCRRCGRLHIVALGSLQHGQFFAIRLHAVD
jgi:hypothetical protein